MTNNLIQHHTKYEEIHGEDKIILMTPSEHRKLHIKLRKENKCSVPADELHEISKKAHSRTNKARESKRKIGEKYRKNITKRFIFSKVITLNISLRYEILHNKNTGTVSVISRFIGNNGTKLVTKEI